MLVQMLTLVGVGLSIVPKFATHFVLQQSMNFSPRSITHVKQVTSDVYC